METLSNASEHHSGLALVWFFPHPRLGLELDVSHGHIFSSLLRHLSLPSMAGCCRPIVKWGFSLQGWLATAAAGRAVDRPLLCYPGLPGLGDSIG